MSNLESNTNNLLVPGLFVRGDEITREEAQAMVDAGQGDNVIETINEHFFEKEWLDGRSTLVMNNVAAESGASTSTTSSSTDNTSTTDTTTGSPPDEASLALAPEVEKLEALAGQLETAADDLKTEHDNAAVDAFESAAGKVARAAEQVRENPTDESAIEEFETATDELKNTAHALEGEIGDEQYQDIVSAVDSFETATDHMLAADDGEADMAGAVAKASDALETLLSATTGLPAEGDVEAADPYKELDALSDQLNALTSGLMDKFGVDELAAYEEATEQLEEAIDTFNAEPTSEASIEGLEKAADALKEATAGLEGKIDDDIYQDVSTAVNAFEEAVDKLSGLDGQQAEIDKVASEIVDTLKDVVKATSEGIEGDSSSTDASTAVETTATENTTTENTNATPDTSTEIEVLVPEPVPGVVATTSLNDLEKATDDLKAFSEDLGAVFDTADLDDFEAATVKLEAAGDNLLADPSQENIDAFEVATDELKSTTHALEGKIDAEVYEKATSAVDDFEHAVDLAVVANSDGDTEDMNAQIASAVSSLQNLANLVKEAVASANNNTDIADKATPAPSSDVVAANAINELDNTVDLGLALDKPLAAAEDILASQLNNGVEEPTSVLPFVDTAVDFPAYPPDLTFAGFPGGPSIFGGSGAERLEGEVDNLKRNAVDIAGALNVPELNQFEASVDKLETAADALAMNPKDKGTINEFKAVANELKDATYSLEGKIRTPTYEKATAAVDSLVDAVDRFGEQGSEEGGDLFDSTGDIFGPIPMPRGNRDSAMHDAAAAIGKLDNVVSDLKSETDFDRIYY